MMKLKPVFSDVSRFKLVDREGETFKKSSPVPGLLLSRKGNATWGPVKLTPYYDNNVAHAICREMGYDHAIGWEASPYILWPILASYSTTYDVNIACTSPYWISCTYDIEINPYIGQEDYYGYLICAIIDRCTKGMYYQFHSLRFSLISL